MPNSWMRGSGSGFRAHTVSGTEGSRYGVSGFGSRVPDGFGYQYMVSGFGYRMVRTLAQLAEGFRYFGYRVSGTRFRVRGFGYGVSGTDLGCLRVSGTRSCFHDFVHMGSGTEFWVRDFRYSKVDMLVVWYKFVNFGAEGFGFRVSGTDLGVHVVEPVVVLHRVLEHLGGMG
jgi:hypothetical protein